MVEFIKVTAKTPYGDTREYVFMGDLDEPADQTRLVDFMVKCCDDCADFFPCPDEWDADEWHGQTQAMWEAMETSRTSFGESKWPNGYPWLPPIM